MKYDIMIGAGLAALSLLVLVMAEHALIQATSTTQEAKEQIAMMRMQVANTPKYSGASSRPRISRALTLPQQRRTA